MQGLAVLKNVRLSFPELFAPATPQGGGAPAYSGRFIFDPGTDNEKVVRTAIENVATAKWKEKAPGILAMLYKEGKVAFKTDPPTDQDGNVRAGFEGKVSVSARNAVNKDPSKTKVPLVVDGNRVQLTGAEGIIYGGCYVHASLEFWAQDNEFGRRINCNIRSVMFAGDGERFSTAAAPPSVNDFDGIAGSDADSFV